MATALQLAERRYRANAALRRRTEQEARRLWRRLARTGLLARFGGLDRAWREIGPRLVALVMVAQNDAVRGSDAYVAAVLAAQGIDAEPAGRVNPAGLVGVASDGRPLDTLLYEPVIAAKARLGQRGGTRQALNTGLMHLQMIVGTQVTDAGRVADGLALAARPGVSGYTRMLNPPSCSRCAILAGKFYRWNTGFSRHPRCDCRHIPTSEALAGDLTTNPNAYFRSLTEVEQNRLFTKAGAQTIRDGGDVSQVVNARRGMYTAGGRKFTRESTTRRGITPGRRRPMPEQLYRDATSRDDAVRLLRRFGYII